MSAEVFANITWTQKILDDIKYLEGSHPELYGKYKKQIEELLNSTDKLHSKIIQDLEKKARTIKPKKRTKKNAD